ncbi:DUF3781 domain-containing protein [Ancylomarina sp. 16SWW S1-10-2]|uniref:DUF3781 domain-containing protein n=1 Tax=Ancylomarina sp. 16SWW S1-10-2 TaxID=2499681 RepID=UPI0034CE5BE3
MNFSKTEIEKMIFEAIRETQINYFQKIGKNFYISNSEKNIKITVNSNTFRIITADKIEK